MLYFPLIAFSDMNTRYTLPNNIIKYGHFLVRKGAYTRVINVSKVALLSLARLPFTLISLA
jgi:hypothetical protein